MDAHRAFFEELAAEWDAQQSPHRQDRLQQLLATFDPLWREARAILDLGTGTGALLPLLRERTPAARLVAVDLAQAMLRRAQARDRRAFLTQADAHQLPFPAETFDIVVCHASFPHFADKPAALAEIRRVLRRGGHLLILHDASRETVNAIHQEAGEVVQADLLPPAEQMRLLLLRAGFSQVKVEDTEEHYLALGRVPLQKPTLNLTKELTGGDFILLADRLTVCYGPILALDNVSLAVKAGEMVGFFGPNGAGKSTFLKTALGLLTPTGGNLSVLGSKVGNLGYNQVRTRIGYVPQKPPNGRFPVTVWEAVAMGRYGRVGVGRPLSARDHALVEEALECLGIAHLSHRLVQQLSGGQAQRVGIARALAQEPELLLLDEPTASLDRAGQLELACQVQTLNRERGITVVMVSHSLDVARLCHRIYFFNAGRVQALARVEELPGYA